MLSTMEPQNHADRHHGAARGAEGGFGRVCHSGTLVALNSILGKNDPTLRDTKRDKAGGPHFVLEAECGELSPLSCGSRAPALDAGAAHMFGRIRCRGDLILARVTSIKWCTALVGGSEHGHSCTNRSE